MESDFRNFAEFNKNQVEESVRPVHKIMQENNLKRPPKAMVKAPSKDLKAEPREPTLGEVLSQAVIEINSKVDISRDAYMSQSMMYQSF